MADPLDRIVKGAPPPHLSPDQLAQNAKTSTPHDPSHVSVSHASITAPRLLSSAGVPHHDPRDALPSSPPQIYLNLLILESSLRLQYLTLRTRLRLHFLLLIILTGWVLIFSYLLFLRPREDGSGVGGSVYWVLESAEKLGWCSGIVTLCLFYGTGMYARGLRWPRKFISTTNRGLRGFNLKVVVVKGGFWSELKGWLSVFDPFGYIFGERRINFQVVPKDIESSLGESQTMSSLSLPPPHGKDHHHLHKDPWNQHAARYGLLDEDIAPGGDVLRVLLLPKPFSPDFREGWDTYRMEYWERENARRAQIRALVIARERAVARKEGGWLWWTGWRGWRRVGFGGLLLGGAARRKNRRQLDLQRLALRERERDRERPGSSSSTGSKRFLREKLRDGSVSRGSSRSSTPAPGGDGAADGTALTTHSRRGSVEVRRHRRTSSSASSTAGSIPRRPRKALSGNEKSRLSATETLFQDNQTWESFGPSPLTKVRDDDVKIKKEEEDEEDSPAIKSDPIFTDEMKSEPGEI